MEVQTPVSALPPPYKKMDFTDDGLPVYAWDITDDEFRRLDKLFGRNFKEANLGGTYVTCPPQECVSCGKWTEFIDWAYTAVQRDVHTPTFMFYSLKSRQRPKESKHDVYCSCCGTITHLRAHGLAEGAAPDVELAGPLDHDGKTAYNAVKKAPLVAHGWKSDGDYCYEGRKVLPPSGEKA